MGIGLSGVMKMWNWRVVMVAQSYTKTHGIVHTERVTVRGCELYLYIFSVEMRGRVFLLLKCAR